MPRHPTPKPKATKATKATKARSEVGLVELAPPKDKDAPVNHTGHKLAALDSLKPHPRNPNTHPDSQIALLAKIIAHQGWRAPIVVSERSGLIVAGHARLAAAQRLGLADAPVNFQAFASDADEVAHLLADNKIAELAELDLDEVKGLLDELQGAIDLELTGFDLSALSGNQDASPPGEFPVSDENISTEHLCPKCGYKWSGGK